MKRREFIQNSMTLAAALGVNLIAVPALAKSAGKKKVVVIFLRGGADVLGMFPPKVSEAAEKDYKKHPLAALRGTSEAQAKNWLFDTKVGGQSTPKSIPGGTHPFNFHPAFSSIAGIIKSDNFLVVPQTGSKNESRSHFEQQDLIESGSRERKLNIGYLARAAAFQSKDKRLAVAIGSEMPTSLAGFDAALIKSAEELSSGFALRRGKKAIVDGSGLTRTERLELYKFTDDEKTCEENNLCTLATKAQENYDDLEKELKDFDAKGSVTFAKQCDLAATLTKSSYNPPIITIDMGGWDTHRDESPTVPTARLHRQVELLAEGLKLLHDKMSDDTVVVVMSEFGRTAVANPASGTDHGRGSAMIVMGKPVSRKAAENFGGWELKDSQLNGSGSSRALEVKIDYREIMGEILEQHLGISLKAEAPMDPTVVMNVFDNMKSIGKRRKIIA